MDIRDQTLGTNALPPVLSRYQHLQWVDTFYQEPNNKEEHSDK